MRNKKASTAALGSVHEGLCSGLRDVPGHPSGARQEGQRRSKEKNQEDATMSGQSGKQPAGSAGVMLAMMLRVAFSLVLWTFGGAAMTIGGEPPKEHRVVYTFAVDRAQTESLQRWVNSGHDSWCRDAQLVAVASMRRISEEFEEVEGVSLPLELEHREKTEAVYTFHSLDGLRIYRMTLKRHEWLLPTAGSMHRMIWVPEKVEIVTRKTLD
ncbi:MAG TPA: hypothetical protein VMJ35_04930 [Dongiaceae bacterium]|nr:hypothetical protein [Dongiaceae bacterium]